MRAVQALALATLLLYCSVAAAQEDLREIELQHRFELGVDGFFVTESAEPRTTREYVVGVSPRFYLVGGLFAGANISLYHQFLTFDVYPEPRHNVGGHFLFDAGYSWVVHQGVAIISKLGIGYAVMDFTGDQPGFDAVLLKPGLDFGYFIAKHWSLRIGVSGYLFSGLSEDYSPTLVRYNLGAGYTF